MHSNFSIESIIRPDSPKPSDDIRPAQPIASMGLWGHQVSARSQVATHMMGAFADLPLPPMRHVAPLPPNDLFTVFSDDQSSSSHWGGGYRRGHECFI